MKLSHSRMPFVRVYFRESQELVRAGRAITPACSHCPITDSCGHCFTPKLTAEVTLQPMRCFSEGCLGGSLKLGNKPNGAVFFIIAGLEPVPSQSLFLQQVGDVHR
jgi:hypothetical protein